MYSTIANMSPDRQPSLPSCSTEQRPWAFRRFMRPCTLFAHRDPLCLSLFTDGNHLRNHFLPHPIFVAMSYFITSISNAGGGSDQSYRQLQKSGASPEANFAEIFKLEVPSLMVGTLDSLMDLSDELGKTDSFVESILRKVEKTAMEFSSFSGKRADLTVGGVPPQRYIQQFAWDYAKYPNRRPLKELVSIITSGVSATEEELRQLANSFSDKMQALADAQRKRSGNLMVAELNDVLSPEVMKDVQIVDTEYLKTIFVAVPKGLEKNFESTVESICNELVGFGGPDWSRHPAQLGTAVQYGSLVDRHRKRGSPVVPGSIKLVKEDGDSFLYTVVILKSQYVPGYFEGSEFVPGTKTDFEEEFGKACRDRRFVVRSFVYDPSQSSKSAMILEQLKVEVDGMRTGITRWCKTHYGELFVAWMHIKVIRVFVESVLRYGLPVDFTAVLYKVKDGKEVALTNALDAAFGKAQEDIGDVDGEEYHDFVLNKFQA